MRKVDVPEGRDGEWVVACFDVSAEEARIDQMFTAIDVAKGLRRRPAVTEGTYTKLLCGESLVMSDTPSEMRDHENFVRLAHGRVFVAGLGLGMVLQALLDRPSVEHVTVLEKADSVIRLVAPHYQARYGYGERLRIVAGDVFEWKPPRGTRRAPYDAAWFDVWNEMCTDHLPAMKALRRRWSKWARYRACWGEDVAKRAPSYCR